MPTPQRPPLETTKTSQPQPVRNEEQRSHLKNSDGQYHNITTLAMKGTTLKMATTDNMQLQTVLAALNIWQWRYMTPMLMIWRTMLMEMVLEESLRIGVISKPLKLRYAQKILG